MRASLRVIASPGLVPPKFCAVEASAWVNSSNSFACCSAVLRADTVRNTTVEHRRRVLENAIEPAAISLDDTFSIVSYLHRSTDNDVAVTAEHVHVPPVPAAAAGEVFEEEVLEYAHAPQNTGVAP
jgi:hypothetical protein